jgi:hypothetical protein
MFTNESARDFVAPLRMRRYRAGEVMEHEL